MDALNQRARVLITRTVEFCAAHRLYREGLSDAENFELFGPCSNPFGHGHNYRLAVTVSGPVDPSTGMVIHFSKLKQLLKEVVEVPLDHRHLNHDVEILKGILPSSENIVTVLWTELSKCLSAPLKLEKLTLYSTEKNYVEYQGERQ